jgi:energy-coupling factor transporter ATP-binding protein EcfA2
MTSEERLELKQLVREAVREEVMFFTQNAINHETRLGKLEERAKSHSMHAKEQDSLLKKLSSGRAQLVYHAITLLTILSTTYVLSKKAEANDRAHMDYRAP